MITHILNYLRKVISVFVVFVKPAWDVLNFIFDFENLLKQSLVLILAYAFVSASFCGLGLLIHKKGK